MPKNVWLEHYQDGTGTVSHVVNSEMAEEDGWVKSGGRHCGKNRDFRCCEEQLRSSLQPFSHLTVAPALEAIDNRHDASDPSDCSTEPPVLSAIFQRPRCGSHSSRADTNRREALLEQRRPRRRTWPELGSALVSEQMCRNVEFLDRRKMNPKTSGG